MPKGKELRFFDRDIEYQCRSDHYHRHFSGASDKQICGEVSPPYFHRGIRQGDDGTHVYDPSDDSAARIKRYNPDIKIVITLRDPLLWLRSQYWKNYKRDRERFGMVEALAQELQGTRGPETTPFCWIYKNSYAIHMKHWFDHFPTSQFKVIIFEEWIHNKIQLMGELSKFLGFCCEDSFVDPDLHKNVGSAYDQPRRSYLSNWKQLLAPLGYLIPQGNAKESSYESESRYPPFEPGVLDMLLPIFAEECMELERILHRSLSVRSSCRENSEE